MVTDDARDREMQLIDEVLTILPEIGRNVFRGMASDPIAHGRSLGQMKVLSCLHHNGRLSVTELASALGVTMSTASELIDKLVDDGLLLREMNPQDRRQVLVVLTPAAEEFGRRFHDLRRTQIRRAFDLLEPDERPIFVKSLRAWARALEADYEDAPNCPEDGHPRSTRSPEPATH